MAVLKKHIGIGIFPVLAAALAVATLVPFAATVLLWRFAYAGNAQWALGLAQIRTALDGATQLFLNEGDFGGAEPPPEAVARLKLLLNGPVVKVRLGPAAASEAKAVLSSIVPGASLTYSSGVAYDAGGSICGAMNSDGSWSLEGAEFVGAFGRAWDSLSEHARRELANGNPSVQVTRDSSKAVIRVGSSGYIWAISAVRSAGDRSYELLHPQMEAVEVSRLRNSRGEAIGANIASMLGRLGKSGDPGVVRYDYSWRNPEDSRERRKMVLMRYLPRWDLVLCAGLYEDEYFLPADAAQDMFVLLVASIGAASLAAAFLFARRISGVLESLAAFSRNVAEGGRALPAPALSGILEFDSLGASLRDMDERIVHRETALRKELEEKRALVEEVHHRVKNNLAVMAGIISLQLEGPESPEAREALEILHARINSMSLVYQQLIGTDEYASLPFDEYLRGLLAFHQGSLVGNRRMAARDERIEVVRVPLEIAVPLGLVVNELVSNAFRHGAAAERGQPFQVSLQEEGGFLQFRIIDDGPGLGNGHVEKTGLLLVRALSAQIKAEFRLESPIGPTGGTRAELRVPL